mgnify:CR=1 FL=1
MKISNIIIIFCISLFSSQLYSQPKTSNNKLYLIKTNNKYGLTDKNGKILVEPTFDFIDSFSDGIAIFSNNGKYGYIDSTGKILVESKFNCAWKFINGIARAGFNLEPNDPFPLLSIGLLDKNGKWILEPKYNWIEDFHEGLAAVNIGCYAARNKQYTGMDSYIENWSLTSCNGKWGYIDKTGKLVIDTRFDDVTNFENGKANVKIGEQRYTINLKGEYID